MKRIRKHFLIAFAIQLAIIARLGAQCSSSGGGGTGFPDIDNAAVSYTTEQEGPTVRLQAATIIRAPASWLRKNYVQPDKPVSQPNNGGGASIGPVMVMYDSDKRRVMFDTVSFAMGDMNILLLEVNAAGVPKEVGRSRVDPVFPGQYTCDHPDAAEHARQHDALLWVLRQSPLVEPFLRKP